MAITGDARIAGSVSGGCVEGAVVSSALEVLIEGRMCIEEYHASLERAHDVGLSCGGSLDVCIYPLDEKVYRVIRSCVLEDKAYLQGIVTCSEDESIAGKEWCLVDGVFYGDLDAVCRDELLTVIATQPEGRFAQELICTFGAVFVQRVLPKPQIIAIGATHIAIALMKMAQVMGYRTIVVDPRAVFATEERFSFVDKLIHAWPEEAFKELPISSATAVCALTHDPKIDEPALTIAARSNAFYIGSLGRTTTQLKRYKALLERDLSREEIARIYGPIGLDIGGKDPTEIALSILSEINAVKYGKKIETRTMLETADLLIAQEKEAEKNAS